MNSSSFYLLNSIDRLAWILAKAGVSFRHLENPFFGEPMFNDVLTSILHHEEKKDESKESAFASKVLDTFSQPSIIVGNSSQTSRPYKSLNVRSENDD